ncbi:MAG TPA: NAD(P)H-binding protein [Pseudonocardiaceae bacterium]|nr:NAD(P)H-binding protein [Pseudonocardiaceae bacterium]
MILVTGATGLIGSRVVRRLAEQGEKVRVVSRDPARTVLPAGVEAVAGDPSRPTTIATALDGVRAVFLNPRAVGTAAPELLGLARERGVEQAVALAASNVDDDPARQPSRYRGDYNREVEAAVVDSGLDWVSLRPSMFATNTIGLWAAAIRAGGVVRMPYPDAAWAPLAEDDLAEVAVHALRTQGLLGRRIELTGPASLTQAEMVGVIGTVLGRELRVERVSQEASEAHLVGVGFAVGFVRALLELQAEYARRPAAVSGEVAEILGRPPVSFADWVAGNTGAFAGVAV